MRCEKTNVVAPAMEAAAPGRYVLDEQVGFLLRIAMQRHTSIFTSRMIEGLTQTQFAARAVTLTERGRQATATAQLVAAEITAATLAPLNEDERQAVVKLLRKLA